MSGSHMRRYWNARAREDPLYFVDTRVGYRSRDEEAFWSGGEQALTQLLAAVGVEIDSGATVVDIGCGVGRLTRALAARSARVVGIDVSPVMLERARALNADLTNIEWLCGDGRTLQPLGDASADVCVSHVVFRHLPEAALTLGYVREIGRVLRPGGTAAIEFSNDPAPHLPGRTRLRDRLGGLVGRGPRGGEDRAWLGSSVDLGELERAAGSADLTVEQVVGAGTEFCAVRLRRRADGTGADASEMSG